MNHENEFFLSLGKMRVFLGLFFITNEIFSKFSVSLWVGNAKTKAPVEKSKIVINLKHLGNIHKLHNLTVKGPSMIDVII